MKKHLLAVAALTVAVTASAQVNPNAPILRDTTFLYGQLENGLTYYIRHNEKPEDRAEFYLLTNVGAIQETPAQAGLAHFLEHMCLNGTRNFPGKGIIEYFESIGAKFGANINASTGVEQTMYMLNNIPVTRRGIIDSALLVLHDYSGFVTNDPAEIDAERGVIIEEWRTRNTAQWRTMEKIWACLYRGSKYADCNIIGTVENLQSFPPEELVNFYRDWYHPGNQAVVVVGDIDPDYILEKLTALYSDIPLKTDAKQKEVIRIPANSEPIVGIMTDPETRATSVEVIVKSEPLPIEMRSYGLGYFTTLVESVINRMLSERLDEAAKKPGSPFFSAGAGFQNLNTVLDGFCISAACKDGEALPALRGVMTEVEKARRYGFTEEEFERAGTNIIAEAERSSSNASSRWNSDFISQCQSDFFLGYPVMSPDYEAQQVKGYLSLLNIDIINQTLAQLDLSDNVVILYNAPEREELIHPSEAEFVSVLEEIRNAEIENDVREEELGELMDSSSIKPGRVRKEASGKFGTTVWTLSNGVRVTMRPSDYNKEQILADLRLFGGTSLIEDEEMPSLDENIISFYTSLGGLSKFNSSDLRKVLTGKIVSWNPYFSDCYAGVEGSCAPKDFETLLQAIHLQMTEPRFVEEDMAPAMAQIEAVVPNMEKQPDYIFGKEFYDTAYGKSPRHELISVDKVGKISFKSFEQSYRTMLSNVQGADLVLTGNFDPDSIKPLVEKYIGSLPAARKAQKYVDRNDRVLPGKREKVFTTVMETPKTSCMILVTGKCRSDFETRLSMQALTDILDLVYTLTIRENEGGTYGVGTSGSVVTIPEERAELMIQFDTDPERADKLIAMAWEGLENIADNGPDPDDLDKFKENRLKNLSENRSTNSYWESVIMGFYNTGVDRDTDAQKAIEGLTPEKIQKFAAELLEQGNVVKVVMNPEK